MGRPACSLVLVCLLCLAGCSGFAGSDGSNAEAGRDGGDSTAGVTPAPVPRTDTARRLAPGLTAEGIENASALTAAHEAVLRNSSYRTRSNRTVEYANGTVRQRVTGTVQVGPNGTAYDARYAYARRPARLDPDGPAIARTGYWSNGEVTYQATSYVNGTNRYGNYSEEFAASFRRSVTERDGEYEGLLIGTETRVVGRTERNGTSAYRVEASNVVVGFPGSYGKLTDRRNATLGLVVGERGLIRSHRLAYSATTEGNATVRVIETVRYDAIGETTIDRPPWYDEALNRTNATDDDR